MNSRGWAVNWSGTLPAIERDMRTFATAILLSAINHVDSDERTTAVRYDLECDRIEACESLADALAAGVTGSLLESYVTACATGIPVEYVFPFETQVLATVPVECLLARNANPAK